MKNSIIPQSELRILGEVFEKVDKLVENHEDTPLKFSTLDGASDLEQLHIVVYMDILKDCVSSVKALKDLLEVSEDDFRDAITNHGEKSIVEAKKMLMQKMLLDMIMN